jgi:hypothetical protein
MRIFNLIRIKRARSARPLNARPSGRRMIVIKMRDGSKEAFAPVLLFKRAFRNVNVRLFRDFAFGEIHKIPTGENDFV